MEMMNRAIEDAADFSDMLTKLEQRASDGHLAKTLREQVDQLEAAHARPVKRPGENRVKYRSRVYGGS
jgi:hypothetical protein